MSDASIGGKTAINNQFGKNLIGAFYDPQVIIVNVEFL
jgi:3-dehydroquinate synthetase